MYDYHKSTEGTSFSRELPMLLELSQAKGGAGWNRPGKGSLCI